MSRREPQIGPGPSDYGTKWVCCYAKKPGPHRDFCYRARKRRRPAPPAQPPRPAEPEWVPTTETGARIYAEQKVRVLEARIDALKKALDRAVMALERSHGQWTGHYPASCGGCKTLVAARRILEER